MTFSRNTLAALTLLGATVLAKQIWNDIEKPVCYSDEDGLHTKPEDIKAIYDSLQTFENPTIPAYLEGKASASGTQLYYCRSTALVLTNSKWTNGGEDLTVNLTSFMVSLCIQSC